MPESAQHADLVLRIIAWVREMYGEDRGLSILVDSVASSAPYRPSQIEGYWPDVEARIVPSSFILLGEAKSYRDVFEVHTERQLTAYLSFLSAHPESVFVFAVPLAALGRGRSLVRRVQKRTRAEQVRVVFIYA